MRALHSSAQRSDAGSVSAFAVATTLLLASALALPAADSPRPRPRSGAAPAPAAAPAGGQPDFEAFRIVAERNIFNPNRVGRSRADDAPPPPRTETIALVGTMESGSKGLQAFFDSSDTAFRKAVREGDEIAGYTVKKIHVDRVELVAGAKTTPLAVAQQLRRTGGGEWTVGARELPKPAASGSPAAEPPPIPAGASDLLRRLMEQRQKQLKQ
ncbi:MAG: hypothetical protein JNL39_02725 [Opitutaceae bacterium]|nr:hypothetical protein [Opitutaceae bacterium]